MAAFKGAQINGDNRIGGTPQRSSRGRDNCFML
jgi:hypothetical protein